MLTGLMPHGFSLTAAPGVARSSRNSDPASSALCCGLRRPVGMPGRPTVGRKDEWITEPSQDARFSVPRRFGGGMTRIESRLTAPVSERMLDLAGIGPGMRGARPCDRTWRAGASGGPTSRARWSRRRCRARGRVVADGEGKGTPEWSVQSRPPLGKCGVREDIPTGLFSRGDRPLGIDVHGGAGRRPGQCPTSAVANRSAGRGLLGGARACAVLHSSETPPGALPCGTAHRPRGAWDISLRDPRAGRSRFRSGRIHARSR